VITAIAASIGFLAAGGLLAAALWPEPPPPNQHIRTLLPILAANETIREISKPPGGGTGYRGHRGDIVDTSDAVEYHLSLVESDEEE